MVSDPGEDGRDAAPLGPGSAREWCAVAVARLGRDQPEAALEAARLAVESDPHAQDGAGWGYRLASLAFERLGRDAEAVAAAEEAVRLTPGSWAARLRLGAALRRVPGRWKEAWSQAGRAARYAPQEPDPHVLVGDLRLLRGEHRHARAAYDRALRRVQDHPGARVNLGLTFLRWERSRGHHDPAWPVDPRETGRARRALESWSRQVRVLLAVALLAVGVAAFGYGLTTEAVIGGAVAPAAALVITLRQAHRVRLWPYVPGMLARDAWLSMSVAITLMAVAAYVAAVATLPRAVQDFPLTGLPDPAALPALARSPWAGLAGLVLLNGLAVLILRTLAEAWRGRPVRALTEFAAAGDDRTAAHDIDVTLWLVAVRAWSVLVLVVTGALLLDDSRWALTALAVPPALGWAYGRVRGRAPADRWLTAVVSLIVLASVALVVAAAVRPLGLPDRFGRWSWQAAIGVLVTVVAAYVIRSARAWWRGAPGPWRGSLVMYEGSGRRLPGDARAPVELSGEVRRALAYGRGVVLAYSDPTGPRALAVGSVGPVGPGGELRLIAAEDAWEATERDPRVAVFVADPTDRRFWAEVRGIAVGDAEADVLRVTPEHVVVGDYPGRHQGRVRPGDGRPAR
ncbi:tetratricopeptide repeat protein [Planobispora siamensis]|uniref:Tetratricopeptide repeat protein n=1 Tax=Planobispora siamensis TaxID=936338 RepID=A0A8J3S9Q1_9ACTN|nr:hypothetical protein [Planobispora siamensis]GIH90472.1 hypothetical protein Psi01_11020 [Planobispora siamensis]